MFTVNARMIVLNMKLISPCAIAIRRNLRAVICVRYLERHAEHQRYRKSR